MTITLFEIKNYSEFFQFFLSILSISIGESERCLFSFWKDSRTYQIDFIFIHLNINRIINHI